MRSGGLAVWRGGVRVDLRFGGLVVWRSGGSGGSGGLVVGAKRSARSGRCEAVGTKFRKPKASAREPRGERRLGRRRIVVSQVEILNQLVLYYQRLDKFDLDIRRIESMVFDN